MANQRPDRDPEPRPDPEEPPARPDPDAPGNFSEDENASEVPEPNEPA
jgi:hypothetical protein